MEDRIISVLLRTNDTESLMTLNTLVSEQGLEADLDPLALISSLLASTCEGADELLVTLSRHASARELIVAVQEAIEVISGADDEDEGEDEAEASLPVKFARIVTVYTHAIPRFKTKKAPSQVLGTTVGEIQQLVGFICPHASMQEGRVTVRAAAGLVQAVYAWAGDCAKDDQAELDRCKTVLASLLDAVLETCANKLSTSLAQRVFKSRFPRLAARSAAEAEWEGGEAAINEAIKASEALGRSSVSLLSVPSFASLILVAHSPALEEFSLAKMQSILPITLTAIQANVTLDEVLALTLSVFFPLPPQAPPEPPLDVLIALITVLPALCSVHPDPSTRHISFRILGQLLRLSPPLLRLQILRDLLAPSEDAFPQMRIAAVGLARDAIVESLGERPADVTNVFASPDMLKTLGPVLLRPDPADLFDTSIVLSDFVEMDEAKRLIECLGFYYVLLLRDEKNKTGVRDPSAVRGVQMSLLGPLRKALKVWSTEASESDDHHMLLPLAAIETNIERIDEALGKLSL